VKIFGGGTATLAGGSLTAGSVDLAGGTLRSSGASGALSSPITATSAGGTLRADSALNLTGSIATAASATLVKTGAGALTISGAQSHGQNATLTVSAGTLNLNANAGGPDGATPTLAIVANSTTNFGATQNLRALSVGPAATATLAAGGAKTLKTGSCRSTRAENSTSPTTI
jgi:autotransporter-associated beta strand protein